jgi:hypothetical protein
MMIDPYRLSQPAEMFLFVGSSNMRSFSSTSAGLPANLTGPMANVQIWDIDGAAWETYEATENSDLYNAPSDAWGPEAEFARQWVLDNPGGTMYIVKIGADNSGMESVAGGRAWIPSGGDLFDEMTDAVDAAKANLASSGIIADVKAVIMFIGGQDAKDAGAAADYETNLEDFVDAVRTDWGNAETHVSIARLKTGGTQPFIATVRAAQESVADADPNMSWFDTDYYPEATIGSAPHYLDPGIVALGYDYYHSYLGDYPALNALDEPTFANVVLLAGFNGADGATSYTEESTAARTATFVGNAQLDTDVAQVIYGSACALFDGTGDAITFPDSADFHLGSGPFVLEFSFRFADSASPTTTAFINQWNSGTNQRSFAVDRGAGGTAFQFSYSTTGANTVSALSVEFNIVDDLPYQFMIERDSNNDLRIFQDGILLGKANIGAVSFFNSTEVLRIGALTGFSRNMNGIIDEIRLVKGEFIHGSDDRYLRRTTEFPRS